MPARPAAFLALLALLASGCAQQNHRPGVGPVDAAVHVPALTARGGARVTTITRPPPRDLTHDEIATRSWRTMTIPLPVDGTWHGPIYGRTHRWSPPTTPRRRGEFPTLESATDLDDPFDAVGEALATPFKAIADAALFLPRLALIPPLRQMRSPDDPYDRVPQFRTAP